MLERLGEGITKRRLSLSDRFKSFLDFRCSQTLTLLWTERTFIGSIYNQMTLLICYLWWPLLNYQTKPRRLHSANSSCTERVWLCSIWLSIPPCQYNSPTSSTTLIIPITVNLENWNYRGGRGQHVAYFKKLELWAIKNYYLTGESY